MKDIHEIQISILRILLFAKSRRYSEIKPCDMEGSQFTFHMDKLIQEGFVEKDSEGKYLLTTLGKEYANQMDTINKRMGKQAKITAKLCCTRREADGETSYLLYNREKNPFINHQGFPTSKIWYGDSLVEGASKGLFNETNLRGESKLIAVRHYRVYARGSKEILEDKTMFIFLFEQVRGKLENKKDGSFEWINESEITSFVTNELPEFQEILTLLKRKKQILNFKEVDHFIDISVF